MLREYWIHYSHKMRRLVTILVACALPFTAAAQTDLDKLSSDARAELDSLRRQFEKEADEALAEYLLFESQLLEEYEKFRNEVMATWGDSEAVESTRKEWVEYSPDRRSRTSVDWEKGEVTVEILADMAETDAVVQERLRRTVNDLLSSRGSTCAFDSRLLKEEHISDRPLLEGMIDLERYGLSSADQALPAPSVPAPSRGKTLDLSRGKGSAAKSPVRSSSQTTMAETYSKRMVETQNEVPSVFHKPEVRKVETVQGPKNVVTIKMELVEDHIPKRAERFKGMISTHSKSFSVDEPLIYAVIEQESAFNPAAQSWVPAYGLMQLVPTSGGRDAYRYVHKKDQIPSPDFLFDPDNNIELGTGYIKLLMSTTFAAVKDPQCRILCVIAAYNTGAGNVSRAINGTRNISKAIPDINKMSYRQLYDHLRNYLPHEETRNYIKMVTEKMEKYKK